MAMASYPLRILFDLHIQSAFDINSLLLVYLVCFWHEQSGSGTSSTPLAYTARFWHGNPIFGMWRLSLERVRCFYHKKQFLLAKRPPICSYAGLPLRSITHIRGQFSLLEGFASKCLAKDHNLPSHQVPVHSLVRLDHLLELKRLAHRHL